MAKLKEYNGRYCESDYENAFLSFLEREGWQYLSGGSIPRASRRAVLYTDDLEQFLSNTNPELAPDEVRQIIDTVRLAGAESDFATLHKVYGWMVNGIQFTPQNGLPRMVPLIDFEHPENNISGQSISSPWSIQTTGKQKTAGQIFFSLSTECRCV